MLKLNQPKQRQIFYAGCISAISGLAPKSCSIVLLKKMLSFTTTFKLFGAELRVAEI